MYQKCYTGNLDLLWFFIGIQLQRISEMSFKPKEISAEIEYKEIQVIPKSFHTLQYIFREIYDNKMLLDSDSDVLRTGEM